ncbi:MAG: restriction endonuclease subunit S [Klebsiella michiganensis]|uniref:restriction endonuclease subunit S n=1 Tax=Klebsiella pasteurii TaxID=2587529 RepID=UPI0028798A60|nr:restriction endonuclease subunit S [Klebsiella pasteurii]ELF4970898.1 restriction endonuclease subunit S [Raoultella planticola]MDS7913898.1 restriction endonuclease subunit S [Klebsiella pasteurii]
MAKYKAYPEYKDSGVEWLGEVPNHWKTVSISRLFSRIKRTGYTEKELLSVYRDYGVIPKSSRDDNNNKPSEDLSPYQLVEPNDLVMNKMKAWQGSIAISEYEGIVSPAYFVYKPNNILFELAHPRYVHYLLRNPIYVTQYLSRSKGIRVNQWDLDPDEFRNIELLLPDKTEQEKIYSFLDHETAKIDNLIEKQQQLIELLKEKRQAVISHAVTKGLNPDVPMKDSGVEWLGEVPEHWGVTRAKFISKIFVPQRNKPEINSDSGIFWVTMENMSQHYITSSHQRVSDLAASQSGSKILPKGAVIASCVGNFGVAAINKVDVIINQQLQAFQPVNVIADYLLAMVSISKNYFELIGTAATLIYVNKEGFENLPVLVPPESEQISIFKFINDNNEKFELLIDHSINQINLLQERRTALISAAVTGKIDVRDWVAPDTQDVEEPQEATA